MALVLAIALSVALYFLAPSFIALLTTNQITRTIAESYLPWVYFTPLLGVWSFLLDGIYVGTTHTREMRNGMVLSLIAFMITAEIALAQFGNHGVWIAYYVLMLMRTATLGFWYRRIPRTITLGGRA